MPRRGAGQPRRTVGPAVRIWYTSSNARNSAARRALAGVGINARPAKSARALGVYVMYRMPRIAAGRRAVIYLGFAQLAACKPRLRANGRATHRPYIYASALLGLLSASAAFRAGAGLPRFRRTRWYATCGSSCWQ
jgi:hypothetical protein